MNQLIVPSGANNPNKPFSDPQKLGQPEHNRSLETTLIGDTNKDYSIGIKDIDEAIMYYFNNVLKLSVVQNNSKITVPIMYGTPENWKTVQSDGYLRDKTGKLLAPLLMFKRDTVNQNRNLGFKLDGNQAHNLQYYETSYNRRNVYSNFNVLNSRSPEKKYAVSVTPDYVTVEYTCVVWTYFVEQMDKLIESLNFASRSYWGDPNRFLFYSSIDSFQESINYNQGDDRAIKNQFTITLNGYLIPDSINKTMAVAASRTYGASQVVFGLEIADSLPQLIANLNKPMKKTIASVIAADSRNININNVYTNSLSTEVSVFLSVNVTKKAASVPTSSTAIFSPASLLQPPLNSGLPTTTVNSFTFFINGQYVPSMLITLTENIGSVQITFNTTSLGYTLESDDEVIAIGKWA
jgi:hypothetical protein